MNELYGGGVIPQRLRDKAHEAIAKYDHVREQVLNNLSQFKNDPNKVQFIKNKIKELDLNKKKILGILAGTGIAIGTVTVGVVLALSALVAGLLGGTVLLASVASVGVGVIAYQQREQREQSSTYNVSFDKPMDKPNDTEVRIEDLPEETESKESEEEKIEFLKNWIGEFRISIFGICGSLQYRYEKSLSPYEKIQLFYYVMKKLTDIYNNAHSMSNKHPKIKLLSDSLERNIKGLKSCINDDFENTQRVYNCLKTACDEILEKSLEIRV